MPKKGYSVVFGDLSSMEFGVEHYRPRILFLCTGNACRSPIAESLLKRIAPHRYEVFSAGSHPCGYVHPLTVEVMAEQNIDVYSHRSKSIREFLPPYGEPPDVIVSLCDYAARRCPPIPNEIATIHWPLFDPIVGGGNHAMRLALFRGVRNELEDLIEEAVEYGTLDDPPFDPSHPLRRRGLARVLGGIHDLLVHRA